MQRLLPGGAFYRADARFAVADDFMRFRVYRAERRVGVEGGDFDHAGGFDIG